MFLRERTYSNGKKIIQILKSIRNGKGIKHCVVRSFGSVSTEDYDSVLKINALLIH